MQEFAVKSRDTIVVFHLVFTQAIHLPWMLPMQTSNIDAQGLVIGSLINVIPFKKSGTRVIRQKKLENWTNNRPNITKKQRLIQFSFTTWSNRVGRFNKSIQITNRTRSENLLFLAFTVTKIRARTYIICNSHILLSLCLC